MVTRIADIIEPTAFTNYVVNKTVEKSELINSGVVVNSPEFNTLASGPSRLINMPFFNDLTGRSEVMSDEGAITPKKIGTNADVARQHGRANAWGANGLSGHLSGTDPMRVIGDLVTNYWLREMQKILLFTMKGVFASSSMSDHVLDISGGTGEGALLTGATMVDAGQRLGDSKENITAVLMHSAVEAYLVKRQLIEYATTVNELNAATKIGYFGGKRVIVDDAMPFDPTSLEAEIYLFGAGAIALGQGSSPTIQGTEIARDALASSGEDFLISRKLFILHPRGVKWTEENVSDTFPSDAEIQDGANWKLVYDPKQIRVIRHKFKISL